MRDLLITAGLFLSAVGIIGLAVLIHGPNWEN